MTNLSYPLILASNSPRRKEILANAGFEFKVETISVNEDYPQELDHHKVAEYLAVKKGSFYPDIFDHHTIITADTTVVTDSEILNKPKNEEEAHKMLRSLSGNAHQVITGVCIISPSQKVSFSEATKVFFGKIDDREIQHYISKYQPFDKAGAYGIQEWIGMIGIDRIEGSYYNVMGLPIRKIYRQLVDHFSDQG